MARWAAAMLVSLAAAIPAFGQVTQPTWYPPLSLYGRPVAQPFFDFPTWARYSGCRPAPLAWGYDPFPNYGPCEGQAACYPSVACPGDFVAHRPSDWYATADFAPLMVDHLNGIPIARLGPTVANPTRMGRVVLSTEDLEPEFAATKAAYQSYVARYDRHRRRQLVHIPERLSNPSDGRPGWERPGLD